MLVEEDFEKEIKVVVLGNGGVGKSSMIRRYCKARALLGASFGAYSSEDKGEGLNGESFGPQAIK